MALVYNPVTGRMEETAAGRPAVPPVGIGLTPEQQAAQRRAQQQQAMAERLVQTRTGLASVLGQAADTVRGAYGTVFDAATVVPRTALGVATGEIPVTFDDRLPGQDTRDRIRAAQQSRQNAQWVADNPAEAQAAQQFGQGVAERAVGQGLAAALAARTPAAQEAPVVAPEPGVDPVAEITAASRRTPALDIAALNRGLAETVSAARPEAPIYQPQERGNYNMYNTDQTALAARAAPTSGINFGFGVGGAPTASEYLAQMAQQDAAEARATQQRRTAAQDRLDMHNLRDRMESDNPFVRRAARLEMEGLNQRMGLGITEAGATDRQVMQGDASRDVAGIQGRFGLAQADLSNAGALQRTQLEVDQRAQQVAAMLAQDQAQFEMDPSNQRGAIIAQLAQLMLQSGDTQGAISALYGTQPAAPARPETKILQGPTGEAIGVVVNGVPRPFTPEEIAELVAAQQMIRPPAR